jgi:hypothetical protein
MALGRLLHTATRLPDGRVLATGGFNRSAEVYDPATDSWSQTGNALNTHRAATAILLANGQVLVAGAGGPEWNSGISSELYDPSTGAWTATRGMVTPRFHHIATLLPDGRVLVTGGMDSEYGGAVLASAELYHPDTGTWEPTSPMSVARRNHTATLLPDGTVLVIGGSDGAGALQSTAETYDPASGTWSQVDAMTVARAYHSATLLPDGRVLVAGGSDQDWAHSASSELFDPVTGRWATVSSMAQPRRQHSATLLPTGHVLVAGGFHEYTGIHTTAEAYDPATGTWLPAGKMATDRYFHTATLLASGKVLVAGGFSNMDQSSAELFFPYFQAVLHTGNGWHLANISGVIEETGQPFSASMYMLQNTNGINEAPLPEGIQEDLARSSTDPESAFVLSQSIVDEIVLSEQQGALTPALQAIAEPYEPEDPLSQGPEMRPIFGRCRDKTVTKDKTLNLNQTLGSKTYPLGKESGFAGTIAVSGNAEGTATGEVKVTLRRYAIFWACIPYGVRFDHARAFGNVSLNYGATLSGTLSFTNPRPWEFKIAKPFLYSIFFLAGPIPVYIEFDLPIIGGLELTASVTGSITYNGVQNARGRFDYICTIQGCNGYANYTQSSSQPAQQITGSVSGRIQPSLYAQAAVRAFLYSERFLYAQLGVRPYLRGDLWGFYGNNCGDADGDGLFETVDALTFDLDWQVHVTAQVGLFDDPDTTKDDHKRQKRWDLWHTPRYHIGFWDLIGSEALQPMTSGPVSVPVNTTQEYHFKMRSCWPYGDTIDYQLAWGDGASAAFNSAPGTWKTLGHTWAQPGTYGLGLTAVKDSHGRQLGALTARSIQVTGSTGSWTPWRMRDAPSGNGDYETIADFDASLVCNGAQPVGIECQTMTGIDWSATGEVYTCSPVVGGVCVNADQPDGACMDYQVRFLCP